MNISIIIPARNEQADIGRTIESAGIKSGVEIIVVDGGSTDTTVRVATEKGARVIASPPGRALQMNNGAKEATGRILLFLHADTLLPKDYKERIERIIYDEDVVCGAFHLAIAEAGLGFRIIEKLVALRSNLFGTPYGDQALFFRTETFQALGGFPEQPIMEDFELVRRAKKSGRVKVVDSGVITSGRRWKKKGILKTTILNQLILFGYFLGVRLDVLARWYGNRQVLDR